MFNFFNIVYGLLMIIACFAFTVFLFGLTLIAPVGLVIVHFFRIINKHAALSGTQINTQ